MDIRMPGTDGLAATRRIVADDELRDVRVVVLLAEVGLGRSNEEVAATLYLSPATARTYVSRLLHKLDARDRSQLVVIAYETGLLGA